MRLTRSRLRPVRLAELTSTIQWSDWKALAVNRETGQKRPVDVQEVEARRKRRGVVALGAVVSVAVAAAAVINGGVALSSSAWVRISC